MTTERRELGVVIAEARLVLNEFEAKLSDLSDVLDELEAETARQRAEPGSWKGWP